MQGQPYTQAFPDLSQVFAPLLKEKDKEFERGPWLIQHYLREINPRLSIFVLEKFPKPRPGWKSTVMTSVADVVAGNRRGARALLPDQRHH